MLCSEIKYSLEKYYNQAVISENYNVTYGYLLNEGMKLAKKLKGQRYGIYCENKLICLISVLACIFAQKTAILLCPEYGEAYNRALVEKSDILNFIIGHENENVEVITEDLSINPELKDVAFIIYTSGSTGTAKGVMLTQRNILSNIHSTLIYYPIDSSSSVVLYRPIYHSTTIFGEFLTSVMAGAELHLIHGKMFMPYIVKYINKYQITNLAGTPTFYMELAKAAKRSSCLDCIKVISVGGECMSAKAAEIIRTEFPNARVFHCYGMTEASPRVTYLPSECFGTDYRCIGKALKNVEMILVNSKGEIIQKPFSIGEIAVKGENIMKGYYKDHVATSKVLKDDWYYTGDCGFFDKKGWYYITGRKDQMCIRSGVNIWLHDVEESLNKNKHIENSYVYIERSEKTKIIAKVVYSGKNLQELMAWCVTHMQKQLIPDRIEFVSNIRTVGCGKKQR